MNMDDKTKAELYWSRFVTVFGKPRDEARIKGLRDELVRVFRPCPIERIAKVVDAIIDEHEHAGWPRIATIKNKIRHFAPTPTPPSASTQKRVPGISEIEAMRSPEGRDALAGGFGNSFRQLAMSGDYTTVEALRIARDAHASNLAAVEELDQIDDARRRALLASIWNKMQRAEADLARRYG